MEVKTERELEALGPPVPLGTVLGLFGAAFAGALGAAFLLPAWAPALTASLGGADAKAPWFLSRASGMVAYLLTWASMGFGLLLGTRLSKAWPGPQQAFALHQHTALLGLAFALFHALVLLGDRFLHPSLLAIAVPFALPDSARWFGAAGQLAFWVALPVALSFWVRKQLGPKSWKAIHWASFGVFALALLHGIGAGTDVSRPWVRWLYLLTGGAVLFLTLARALSAAVKPVAVRGSKG